MVASASYALAVVCHGDVWDWHTDLLFVGAMEDAARRPSVTASAWNGSSSFWAMAIVLVIVAALMLLLGR